MSDIFIDGPTHGDNVHGLLGVTIVEANPDKVILQVEVGPKVHQPYGLLHGGVSALLAESAASIGGAINVRPDYIVVGTEINCSHLRSMSSGVLTATATPVRLGRRVHVWVIDLTDQDGRQICVARCTLLVLEAPSAI
jgi:uncharacterized protein (TIGR00369 family)